MSTKKFAVAGVSGQTGGATANALLERGAAVRVIVRDPAKAEAWKARGAEVAVAELGDAKALTAALQGVDGAYLLAPPDLTAADVLANRRALAETAAAAARDAGLPHLVYLSSVGAHLPEGTGVIRTAHVAEQILGPAAVPVTFVRASYFTENWSALLPAVHADGVLPIFWSADRAIPHVATADIGRTVADALLEGPGAAAESGQRILELVGPDEASPGQVAALFAELLGREVKVAPVPPQAHVDTFLAFGASRSAAELFAEMYQGIDSGVVDFEFGEDARLRGTTPVREVLAGMVGG